MVAEYRCRKMFFSAREKYHTQKGLRTYLPVGETISIEEMHGNKLR